MRNTNELQPVKCDQQLTDVFYSSFDGTQRQLYQLAGHQQLLAISLSLFFQSDLRLMSLQSCKAPCIADSIFYCCTYPQPQFPAKVKPIFSSSSSSFLRLPFSGRHPTSLRIFYLVRADTLTHYLWLGPEASAQCQMGGEEKKKGLGQATGTH